MMCCLQSIGFIHSSILLYSLFKNKDILMLQIWIILFDNMYLHRSILVVKRLFCSWPNYPCILYRLWMHSFVGICYMVSAVHFFIVLLVLIELCKYCHRSSFLDLVVLENIFGSSNSKILFASSNCKNNFLHSAHPWPDDFLGDNI